MPARRFIKQEGGADEARPVARHGPNAATERTAITRSVNDRLLQARRWKGDLAMCRANCPLDRRYGLLEFERIARRRL